MAAAGGAEPEAIREATREILAGPEFAAVREDPFLLLLRKAWAWVVEFLERLASLSESRPILYWAIVLGLVAILILLCWHIAWTVRRVFRKQGVSDRARAGGGRGDPAATWLAHARAAAAAGDTLEALRGLFLAVLHGLDAAGTAPFPRTATNREYLALVRARGATGPLPLLEELVRTLDRHWYARVPVGPETYAGFEARCAPWLPGTPARVPAGAV